MTRRTLLRLGGLALSAAAGAAFATCALAQPPARVAPEMTFATPTGELLKLGEDHAVVHLLFVARWCPPCETEVQNLRRDMARFHNAGYHLVLIGVDRRETAAEFAEWVHGLGFDGTYAFDDRGRLEQALGAELLPWHAVVGPGRKILSSGDRAPDPAQLGRWLAER